MSKTAINIKKSHIINERQRVITISVLDTVDDEAVKEVMSRVKTLSSDEIIERTKWLEVSELDKRTGYPDLAFQYHHGILPVDGILLIVTMGKIVKCINEDDKK